MGKVAFLFAGQGAQAPGMGRSLEEASPAAKAVFDMAERLRPGTRKQCFEGTKEELSLTLNTQPCLFCVDLAAAEALRERGIAPAVVAGFSLGEIPALCFAGMLSMEEAFQLVCMRAKAMQACAEKRDGGMMAVVGLLKEAAEDLCDRLGGLYAVNDNCPGQLVVAGPKGKLTEMAEKVRQAGGRGIALPVSGAFHSPDMAGAQAALETHLAKVPLGAPRMPVIANLTAKPYAPPYEETLARQAAHPVRWQDTLRHMAAEGVTTFVEVGPGRTLSGFVRKTLPEAAALNVEDGESLERTLRAWNGETIC